MRLTSLLMSAFTAAFLCVTGSIGALAQDFPSKPVRIVLISTPGSVTDTMTRVIAPHLEALWKQPVIIENRVGADGQIGTSFVARSDPDGYTLLVGSQSMALSSLLTKDLPHHVQKDFIPIYKIGTMKIILATNAKSPAENLTEFFALAKENPGKLRYGGTGPRSVIDNSFEMIKRDMGLDIKGIPFPGPPQTVLALLRDDVQIVWNTANVMQGNIDTGETRPLAAVAPERYPDMPDLQTIVEAGYKGFIPVIWQAMFAPVGTPPEVVAKLGADMRAVVMSPEVVKELNDKAGMIARDSSPEIFKKEFDEEIANWAAIFEAANIQPQ